MKKIIFPFILLFLSGYSLMYAQKISFQDDNTNRGYYDRSYARYEAEAGRCETNGIVLAPTYDQQQLQSEASNQSAVQLMAKNDYVQWVNASPADGMTLRFSLPDSSTGTGTQGTLALYVDGVFVQNISLNSYWAWQYIPYNSSTKYPDNTPDATTKFPRMRFDEMHLKLPQLIQAGSTFRLVKADDNASPYTVDFVELETVPAPVTFDDIADANKVSYSADQGSLVTFISQNRGKTIYLPAGEYDVDNRISIAADNTKIIGAGMWYTQIYFTASSDQRSTYNLRGIETYNNNIVLEGLYINTINNKRYYQNNDSYQVGKGLMGSFGSNSVVRNVWIEHFECGGWIEKADGLLLQNCRFRNNYADGINFSYGSKNSAVEHSSFRNNGDDDMASWSRADGLCENNTFRYCTAENNWRASSLGFFGGKQNKAYNCVIIDPMEAGFRATCDFPGMPFSADGYSEFYNISVYKGGVAAGAVGVSGDLWGNQQGALHLNSSSQYDLQNIKISNIDFYNSKNDAVFIGSNSKYIISLIINNLQIHTTGRYGMYFSGTKGNGTYCDISYEGIGAATNTNSVPAAFTFVEDCSGTGVNNTYNDVYKVVSGKNILLIQGPDHASVTLYDVLGREKYEGYLSSGQLQLAPLHPGVYIVKFDNSNETRKAIVY